MKSILSEFNDETAWHNEWTKGDKISGFRIGLANIVLRSIFVLSYPILYLLLALDYLKHGSVQTKWPIAPHREPGHLFHDYMGGAGDISCRACGHEESITSFTHGVSSSSSGFQCQHCGKFHTVDDAAHKTGINGCDCGGQLVRDEGLFCPSCRSYDLSYEMGYIN